MTCLHAWRYASIATVAMLAGCGGSQAPIGAPGAMPQTSAVATHADRGKSWMLPEAKSEDLMYITNAYTVTVYSYPKGKLVGTLRHFLQPLGECVDQTGDVFIANGAGQVFEYAHGGKKPIATLTLSGYAPGDCAVDPATGNLAVTWYTDSQGYVAVYSHGSGNPTLYSNGDMLFTWCGYDSEGNLYVDGVPYDGPAFLFAELPKGSGSLTNITLDQYIGYAGPVQWDGKYVAVTDVNAIYRFSITGSSGTLKGTVNLDSAQSLYGTWILDKKVIGSDEQEPDTTFYWDYPAGGQPIKTLQLKGIGAPVGVTISKATK
jgi:hypothetical protein